MKWIDWLDKHWNTRNRWRFEELRSIKSHVRKRRTTCAWDLPGIIATITKKIKIDVDWQIAANIFRLVLIDPRFWCRHDCSSVSSIIEWIGCSELLFVFITSNRWRRFCMTKKNVGRFERLSYPHQDSLFLSLMYVVWTIEWHVNKLFCSTSIISLRLFLMNACFSHSFFLLLLLLLAVDVIWYEESLTDISQKGKRKENYLPSSWLFRR